MKTTIYEMIANTTMFILLGLAITSVTVEFNDFGFNINYNMYTLLFLACLLINLIVSIVSVRKQGGKFSDLFSQNQIHKDYDEREIEISNKANKNAYSIAIISLVCLIFIQPLVAFLNAAAITNFNMMHTAVWSAIVAAISVSTTYSLTWILSYIN